MSLHHCRVCGYYSEDPPWGEDGIFPSYHICPCCGVEAGYEDITRDSAIEYRARWMSQGCVWFRPEYKPAHWDRAAQFNCIPEAFR